MGVKCDIIEGWGVAAGGPSGQVCLGKMGGEATTANCEQKMYKM